MAGASGVFGYPLATRSIAQKRLEAHAQTTFLHVLGLCLPPKALNELRDIPSFELETAAIAHRLQPWQDWSIRWNVPSPWVAEWAHLVTVEWRRTGTQPNLTCQLVSNIGPIGPLPDNVTHHRSINMPQPDPRTYSRQEYMKRAGAEWDAAAKLLRAAGWLPMKIHPKMALHCEWTVKYRVLGLSMSDLASLYSKKGELSTISVGIHSVERLVGLPPSKINSR